MNDRKVKKMIQDMQKREFIIKKSFLQYLKTKGL